MDPGLGCWSLGALLCSLLLLRSTAGDATNGSDLMKVENEGDVSIRKTAADVLLSLREKLDETKAMFRKAESGPEASFLDYKPWGVTKAKTSPKKPSPKSLPDVFPSSAAPTGQGYVVPSTKGPLMERPAGINSDHFESPTCAGCGGETYGKPPSRSLLSERNGGSVEPVTSFEWPAGQATVDLELRKSLVKGDKPSVTESQEDSGSGDAHVKMQPSQATDTSSLKTGWDSGERVGVATLTPFQTTTPGSGSALIPSTEKAISPDSAEIDHLLEVSREADLQPPSPSGTEPRRPNPDTTRQGGTFEAGRSQGPLTVLEKMSSKVREQGAEGVTDMATKASPSDISSSSTPPNGPLRPSETPSDLIDIDYNDPSDIDEHWGFPHFTGSSIPGGDSTKNIHDKIPPWHKPLHYDDFSPFDDSYFYPTPSFYAEYEEGGIEDEDDDDDLEEVEDLDDDLAPKEVGYGLSAATQIPKVRTVMVNEKPTGGQNVVFRGELSPNSHPELNRDQTQTMAGAGDNSTDCRMGYIRRNNSCRSLCDIYPTYCYNGGQCYIVENTGVFCRCNTQDYIWHKGLRCESIITDFQVMCVAVGTAALMVLLLFMMTVFFAKKLYLLKTENYKLRKRKYRTPSELHNDNFSLSTIAEGSHPNEDPNTCQKVQDLPKACPKDEEPFNIQNTLSPKLESGKGDPDIVDVNCVLNNLT